MNQPAKTKPKGESAQARIDALRAELAELEGVQKATDAKDLVDVYIDVPAYAAIGTNETGILVNNVHYQYGHTYKVSRAVAASLTDIMARAYEHEDQTRGEGRHVRGIVGRKPSNRRIRGF